MAFVRKLSPTNYVKSAKLLRCKMATTGGRVSSEFKRTSKRILSCPKDTSIPVDDKELKAAGINSIKNKPESTLLAELIKDTLEEELKVLKQENLLKDEAQKELHEELKTTEEKLQSVQLELHVYTLKKVLLAQERIWKISHREVILTKQELGRGRWGVVFVGMFRDQRVAVKQLHEMVISVYTLQLFHREIYIMAGLHHPNLLQFIGAVFDHPSGNPMIITELMDTSLLEAYEEKELTPDQQPVILSIMYDVAVGLNYLHSLPDPIIHHDISSDNILLNRMGPGKWKAILGDFGSAKIARLAVTPAPGAMAYSAPETMRRFNHSGPILIQTTKIDVYSYGILMCEALTCQFPIDSETFTKMLDKIKRLPNGSSLHALIVSCIQDDPRQRTPMCEIIEIIQTLT